MLRHSAPDHPAPVHEPNGLWRVLRYLSLRPYGSMLLSPAAAFWVFAVRIAILLMATAEASAWSYAAFYLATGGNRWLAGTGAFLFTFATVCLIDASLMTLDRWARRYDHRVISEAPAHWANRAWDVLSIGTRVGLVALSMYITAPFLTQLMFTDDIERALRDERVAIRATARRAVLDPFGARASTLQAQLDERRAALDAEVAGAGQSGKYGDGVAARQIRATIAAIEEEKATVTTERQRLATEFDGLSDEAIAGRYKLAMPGDSFQERARVLATIKTDQYRLTERAVQAFLAFLFLALVLLKLFEPRSVRVYFSERLQGLYRQYAGGLFDPHVDPVERSTGAAPMGPLRFEDWCLNTYPAVRARDVHAVTSGERTQFFGNSASELGAITAAVVAEEAALIADLSAIDSQVQQAAIEHAAARRVVEGADGQLAEIRSQRAALEGGLKRPASAQTLATIVNTLSELEASAGRIATEKAAAQDRLDLLTPLVDELETRRADVTSRMDKVAATRKQSESALAEVRMRHMAELNRASAARWPAAPQEAARYDDSHDAPKHLM